MNAQVVRILINGAALAGMLCALPAPALSAGTIIAAAHAGTVQHLDAAPDDWQAADDAPGAMSIPPYPGLTLLTDAAWGYQLWLPAGWRTAESEGADGSYALVVSRPGADDIRFSITAQANSAPRTIFDLPAMSAEFAALRDGVPGSSIEWQARWHRGTVRGFEALTTVAGGDQEPQRWVCLRYQGTRRYWLVAEAPSSADFEANSFAFMVMMHSFRIR